MVKDSAQVPTPIPSERRVHKNIGELYRWHFRDRRRERLFVASLSFLVTFAIVRAITYSIRAGFGPFRNIESSNGEHVHHLVWGVLLLLIVGYLWLLQEGTGLANTSTTASNLTALFFGIGSALTLDEFALWFHFVDVYWEREGRQSVDAVILFGTLLWVAAAGAPFLHGLATHLPRWIKRSGEEK
jgi:hypothetical protein